MVPYSCGLEMFIWGLRMHGERLGVGERLDGNVELGVW